MANRNELYHYGVIGMKWGIRRYQNRDGTLTPAGKQRLKESGSYMNPRKANGENDYSRHAKNRRAVVEKLLAEQGAIEYENSKKAGRLDSEGNVKPYWADTPEEVYNQIWDKYIDQYADATLKDLKIKPTQQAMSFVKDQIEHERFEEKYYHDIEDLKRERVKSA